MQATRQNISFDLQVPSLKEGLSQGLGSRLRRLRRQPPWALFIKCLAEIHQFTCTGTYIRTLIQRNCARRIGLFPKAKYSPCHLPLFNRRHINIAPGYSTLSSGLSPSYSNSSYLRYLRSQKPSFLSRNCDPLVASVTTSSYPCR